MSHRVFIQEKFMISMGIREGILEGQLMLCATPIGNLEDITLRVLTALQTADLIAAEDTRNSIKLLNHFEIKTPMTSYHEHNKQIKGPDLIKQMKNGKTVVLITDAGTPAISDPGEDLVKMAYEAGIKVTSLPGACACITALTLSGLPTRRFVFEGFLPTDKKEKRACLSALQNETKTMLFYEAPHRLVKTLETLFDVFGDRKIAVCRELTKRYETVLRASLREAIVFYEENPPKGECVLVLDGADANKLAKEEREKWEHHSIKEHMERYLAEGMDQKSAMKKVAKDRGLSKRDIYKDYLEEKA